MMKTLFITLALACSACLSNITAQTQLITHRGYWDCEGSAQNSIASLLKSKDVKAYGSELDVIITADGVPVVHHDVEIDSVRIEDINYDQIKDRKLSNGEVLPTLDDYLTTFKTIPDMKLVLEIKPHKRVVNEDRAVNAVVAMVEKYQLEDRVDYISFSMNICKELKHLAPYAPVAYLFGAVSSDDLFGAVSPADLKRLGLDMDYQYEVFDKYTTWIAEAKKLGVKVNVWTVNKPEIMRSLVEQGVDYITTNAPLEFNKIVQQ